MLGCLELAEGEHTLIKLRKLLWVILIHVLWVPVTGLVEYEGFKFSDDLLLV